VRDALKARIGHDPARDPSEAVTDESVPEIAGLLPEGFDAQALAEIDVPLERFGIRWSATILRGTDALKTLPPANVEQVSYEALVAHPEAELLKILEFLGIPEGSDWARSAASQVERRPDQVARLSSAERRRLERVCSVGEARLQRSLRAPCPGG